MCIYSLSPHFLTLDITKVNENIPYNRTSKHLYLKHHCTVLPFWHERTLSLQSLHPRGDCSWVYYLWTKPLQSYVCFSGWFYFLLSSLPRPLTWRGCICVKGAWLGKHVTLSYHSLLDTLARTGREMATKEWWIVSKFTLHNMLHTIQLVNPKKVK